MEKKLIALLIGALLALMIATPASAGSEKTVTLVGTEYDGGAWCCGHYMSFRGTASLPKLGAVTFDGTFANGIIGLDWDSNTQRNVRQLSLYLEAANGDTVSIWGRTEWVSPMDSSEEPELSWSFRKGTGRFSDLSGAGTFTVTPPDFSATHTVALTIQEPWRG